MVLQSGLETIGYYGGSVKNFPDGICNIFCFLIQIIVIVENRAKIKASTSFQIVFPVVQFPLQKGG